MLRDDDLSRHPPSPLVYIPHPETPEEIVESPQEIIDLTKYVDVPNREGMKASYELSGKTGPIPLGCTFMNYFPPGISNINVNKYDIIQTDEYRDNGLYFVYGRNGLLYVIQTPGNYSLPEQALPMLQQYNVRTQDDFYRIDGVQQGDLDLFGIQLGGEDYSFANDESEIGEEGNV